MVRPRNFCSVSNENVRYLTAYINVSLGHSSTKIPEASSTKILNGITSTDPLTKRLCRKGLKFRFIFSARLEKV